MPNSVSLKGGGFHKKKPDIIRFFFMSYGI